LPRDGLNALVFHDLPRSNRSAVFALELFSHSLTILFVLFAAFSTGKTPAKTLNGPPARTLNGRRQERSTARRQEPSTARWQERSTARRQSPMAPPKIFCICGPVALSFIDAAAALARAAF